MAIDLTAPQAIAEAALFGGEDTCTIHREPAPSTTFDEVTGVYVKPAPILVYAGDCLMRDEVQANAGGQQTQGAGPATMQRWITKIPLGSPEIHVGDVVTLVTGRDATLVGKRYVVRDFGGGTFKVVRTLKCERWQPGATQDWMTP